MGSRESKRLDLNSFPPEILAQVLGFPNSSLSLKLWLCGNRILNSKLVASITDIDLKAITYSARTIPLFILNLTRLRRLRLSSDRALVKYYDGWGSVLQKLPKTLEALELLSYDAFYIFKRADDSQPYRPLVDVSSSLPHLSVLRLDAGSSQANGWTEFLPSTLTVLHCTLLLDYTAPEGNRAAHLPRSLLELRGTTHIMALDKTSIFDDWKAAPPSLENGGDLYFDDYVPKTFKWLPRTIQHLYFDPSTHPTTTKLLQSLPPLLASVNLLVPHRVQIDSTWMASLPTALGSLHLHIQAPQAIGASLAHLPRSLTDLYLSGAPTLIDLAALRAELTLLGLMKFWPPNLRSLRLGSFLKPLDVELLPTTLTSLSMGLKKPDSRVLGLNGPPALNMALFPQSLTDLSLDFDFSIELQKELPPSLTRFSTYGESCTLTSLPHALKSLDIQPSLPILTTMLQDNVFLNGLTELKLYYGDCEHFEKFPRTLTKLIIGRLAGTQASSKVHSGKFLAGLPPGVTRLDLGLYEPEATRFTFPSEPLASMLPNLRLFVVRSFWAVFSSSFVRELPRRLEVLEMSLYSIDKKDAPFLPQDLFSCVLHRVQWEKCTHVARYWPIRCIFDLPSNPENLRAEAGKWRFPPSSN